LRRIENSPRTDFTDVLVEKNIYSKSEVDEIIRKFEAFEDAKEMVETTIFH